MILKKIISLERRMSSGGRVIKTHCLPFELRDIECTNLLVKQALKQCKIIYIFRDGMDVLTSMYLREVNYSKLKIEIGEYIRQKVTCMDSKISRVLFWKRHIELWNKEKDILVVKYDDLINNPEFIIKKISNYIECEYISVFVDVRVTSDMIKCFNENRFSKKKQLKDGVSRTSIHFRKGLIGDHVNHFKEIDTKFFQNEILL